jgi:hypothetical protein
MAKLSAVAKLTQNQYGNRRTPAAGGYFGTPIVFHFSNSGRPRSS